MKRRYLNMVDLNNVNDRGGGNGRGGKRGRGAAPGQRGGGGRGQRGGGHHRGGRGGTGGNQQQPQQPLPGNAAILQQFLQLGNQNQNDVWPQLGAEVAQEPGSRNHGSQNHQYRGAAHQGQGRGQNNRGRGGFNRNQQQHQNQGRRATNGQGDGNSNSDSEEEHARAVVPHQRKKREKKHEGPVFGFKRLYNFLNQNPDVVLLSINQDKTDWKALLESNDLEGEKLIIAIQVLGEKICADVPVLLQQQANALGACCSQGFIDKLAMAIPRITGGIYLNSRRRNNEFPVDSEPTKVLSNVLNFCSLVIKTMPETAKTHLASLICTCMGASVSCDPTMTMMNRFKALQDQITELVNRQRQQEATQQRRRREGFNAEDEAEFDAEPPPDSIQEIEIIPRIEELRRRNEEVFIRPNKTRGKYNDANHYLDVQFRLLREDFVQPLRKGINIFLKEKSAYLSRRKKMPLGEVRLYTEITFLKVEKERDQIVHKLQLHERYYKKIKWDKSKRLLTGSLILFTTEENCFGPQNTHMGVVFSRNSKELEKGILTVTWEGTPPVYDEDEDYFMLESEVYLEAYRYTLETLKSLDLERFPMKKFIVDAESSVGSPAYLKNATKQLEVKLASGEDRWIAPMQWQWPSAEDFGLDENQLNAFKAALTKEFTIIQGPPGTGKTFLGLKVAEVLLKNSALWEDEEGNPITVVCYTNHALDQFLEGILKYYKREDVPAEIIRIGGRCKSEVLAKYSLKEVRQRNRRRIPQWIYVEEREKREEIYELEAERGNRMNEVTGLRDVQGIVDFEQLSTWRVIEPLYPKVLWSHLQKLKWLGIAEDQMSRDRLSVERLIKDWFSVREFPKRQSKTKQQHQDVVPPKAGQDAMDLDDDEEDYDLDELQENRILDDDIMDILLEAETSLRQNVGRRLCYLPESSVHACEKRMKQINRDLAATTKGMSMNNAIQVRETVANQLKALENRKNVLAEICRLFKGQLLDLPDVTELLNDITTGGTVHWERLRMQERWALYFEMVERARRSVAENVAEIERNLAAAQRELRNIIQYGDGLVLRGCKVVGLTTTGAAKYNNLLKMIKSKIVIVEEAAEVFESHIVTCITENCEQLILIGDHRQLRPSPTVYDLAVRYHLDLSLFERMINNNLHCYPLKIQHRMRPTIAELIVDTIYDELVNHDHVKMYPDVKGVTKNVYFLTHTEMETSETDSTSKSNKHEAMFLAGLCRYLTLQGYTPDEITVLTMYTGQMFLLKKEIGQVCKGVRITCVDNFQGEENKIILLSLVRSNSSGKIGFLGVDNRICVSLSRAQHGLFIIGNMEQMAKNETWRKVRGKLELQDGIGPELELECQIHGTRSRVKKGEDFLLKVPEGGCHLLCASDLQCSHRCKQVCHVMDKDHQLYKCREPCLKKCPLDHPCKARCYESCPPCMIQVEKTLECERQHTKVMPCHRKVEGVICWQQVLKKLPCNHEETLACNIKVEDYTCKVKVLKTLPCEHKKTMECHQDPELVRCKEVVEKMLPCDHPQNTECWVNVENVKCETMVTKKFSRCGHETQVKCGEKDKPIQCKGSCTSRLDCGHSCVKVCHVDEDPQHLNYQCRKECSRSCNEGHKCKTKHQCFKTPCPPCTEVMLRTLPCGHQKALECHVNIQTYECLETCERLLMDDLRCRHKCPNLCFQPCGPCTLKVKKRAPCGHPQDVLCSEPALKELCEELVSPRVTPVCGHKDGRVPCKFDSLPAEEVVKYCQYPCKHNFNPAAGGGCAHQCKGTCSACMQGRIHMKCGSECGRQLVCGHVCEVPCSAVCPPCKKPCLMKCEHSECTKRCGEPCSDCKEKCNWNCVHKKCSKLCGEMCDREPCNEPCPKKLKCDHDCVGFCGEPCPPLCRQCDRDELCTIFFGEEDEDDARFVYLEDCGHTIEANGLETWITRSGDGQIVAKQCPRCKTGIRNCRRYGNLIRQHYQNIVKVKMRAFGNPANSERMRNAWITRLSNDSPIERTFPHFHARLRNLLVQESQMSTRGLTTTRLIPRTIDEFAMRSIDFIAESTHKVSENILELRRDGKLISPSYERVLAKFRETLGCMLERHPLSRQETIDFNEELDRLDYYKQLMMRRCLPACNTHGNTTAYKLYTDAKTLVTSWSPFTLARKETFRALLRQLDDSLKSGLGITERERREILQAMGMGQGHWYTCPNGHVYVITECGGAMQEGTCNECGARIGGGNHSLRSDNRLATQMDGATQPAWPTGMM